MGELIKVGPHELNKTILTKNPKRERALKLYILSLMSLFLLVLLLGGETWQGLSVQTPVQPASGAIEDWIGKWSYVAEHAVNSYSIITFIKGFRIPLAAKSFKAG